MKAKDFLKKAAKVLKGTPPVNGMYASDVAYIQQKVREQTEFDVVCMDSRLVNCRKNVGLAMPETTAPEVIKQAEDVFIAAAKERGMDLDRTQVLHYTAESKSNTGRVVTPAPKTW
jgi:hypothetical protein